MIQVTFVGMRRTKEVIDESTKIKAALEERHMDYLNSMVTLDGSPLDASELNSTFADLGITDSCYLASTHRKDNA